MFLIYAKEHIPIDFSRSQQNAFPHGECDLADQAFWMFHCGLVPINQFKRHCQNALSHLISRMTAY